MSFITLVMIDTLKVVKKLESQIFELLKRQDFLEKKLEDLEFENSKFNENQKLLYKKIQHLATENDQLKTANAMLGSKDYKRETKLKINRLIREVDSCIVQLSD